MVRALRSASLPTPLLCALLACAPGPAGESDTRAPAFDERRLSPLPGAQDVDPRAAVVLPFVLEPCEGCEPACDVDPSSLDGKVALTPAPLVPPAVSLDVTNCALVLRVPGGLPPLQNCKVEVLSGVKDVSGNATATGLSVPFTTAKADATDVRAPTLVGTWPAAGDDRVGRRTPVTLYFDEEVVAPAVVSGAPALLQRAKPASWSLELVPADRWPSGVVTLSVSGVADRAGNRAVRASTLQFTVTSSSDVIAPAFNGALSATREDGALVVRWEAAHDDASPATKLRYLVHLGRLADGPGLLPAYVTVPGALEARLAAPDEPLAVRVAAQDEAGNVDPNAVVVEVP